jgi:hypothetical protein
MDKAHDPYREPDSRPTMLESPRWYVRRDETDPEEGPFSKELIQRSVDNGVLNSTFLVRAEDEPYWHLLGAVEALRPPPVEAPTKAKKSPPRVRFDEPRSAEWIEWARGGRRHVSPPGVANPQGELVALLLAILVVGLVGLAAMCH